MSAIVLGAINAKWIHPSLALRLLQANLPLELGSPEHCVILEFALRQPLVEKITAVLAEKPKILTFSVSIWNHEATLELLEALEAVWPENGKPVIVLGGPELTPLPPDSGIFRHADFVIRGEGELVFALLCQAILANLAAAKKKYGKFIEAAPVDLKKIKSAYTLYTTLDLEHKLIYVESSRGCPFQCAFCQSAVKAVSSGNSAIREFPLEPFLDDLDGLLQRCRGKTKTIKFLDRSFNVNLARAIRILEFCLEKIKNAEKTSADFFQFHFEMVPAIFSGELLGLLAMFPNETIRLEIGIQSFNAQTCNLIRRNSNPKKELDILRSLREKTKTILHVDLIAGLPGEDLASFGKGFDNLWMALGSANNGSLFEIQPGILKCLPGTPICRMAEKGDFNVTYNKIPPYEVIETDCLPVSDMEKIKNFARFWELIVNRRAFPELLPLIAPYGKPVFAHFMDISQKLLGRFGKNWGIPKNELHEELRAITGVE